MQIQETESMTVAFLTLGCKVNSYESDAMQEMFINSGYTIKGFHEKADVYVVNTCTVTNIADRKSRQMLHKAKKMNPNGIVVAVGCYVQASKEVLEEDEAIDLVVGNNQKQHIVSIVQQYKENQEYNEAFIDINQEKEYEPLGISEAGEKTRAYIKVQDGCNQFCSYCIIPYARGRVRSRKKEQVLTEVERLVAKGYKEIVLTGIHLSSYGIDLEPKDSLLSLITTISEVDGLERIRLGSLEPRIITEEFVETLTQNKKFCPHFHLSLQSGCDETLKRMNRRYDSNEYYEKCCLIREYFEHPAITTDVIVGFPGETEEEFEQTKEFVQKVDFAQIHVFKYSKRKGTRAEKMPNQVEETVKHARSKELIELASQMTERYKEQFLGKKDVILVEEVIEVDGEEYQIGHNKCYLKLAIKATEDHTNQLLEVKVVKKIANDLLLCEIIN